MLVNQRFLESIGEHNMSYRLHIPATRTKQIGFMAAMLLVLLGASRTFAASDNTSSELIETEVTASIDTSEQSTQQLGVSENNSDSSNSNSSPSSTVIEPIENQSEIIGGNTNSSSVSIKIDSSVSTNPESQHEPNPADVSVEINGESVTPDSRGRIRERFENENTESSIRVDIDDDTESSSDITFDISVEGETKDVRR